MFNLRNYNNDTIFTFSDSVISVLAVYKYVCVSKEILCYNRKRKATATERAAFKSHTMWYWANLLFSLHAMCFEFKMGVILGFLSSHRVVEFYWYNMSKCTLWNTFVNEAYY